MYNTWPSTITMNAAGYVADTACCVSPLLSALSAKSAERNIGHGTNIGRAFSVNNGALSIEMATVVGIAKSAGEGRMPRMPRHLLLQQLSQQQETRPQAEPQLPLLTDRRAGFTGSDWQKDQKLSDFAKVRGGDLAQ